MRQISILFAMFAAIVVAVAIGCASQDRADSSSPFSSSSFGGGGFGGLPSVGGSSSKVTPPDPPPQVDPQAPDQFRVRFSTTKGDFVAEVNRAWAPRGADRFYQMVNAGFFQDIVIFRAVENFMFQFGIHDSAQVNEQWGDAKIPDDPRAGIANVTGTLSFANSGPNTRSTQMFVNLGRNAPLDAQGFTPFAKVVEGLDVCLKINTEYGENERGVQGKFRTKGNDYILKEYPRLDIIRSVSIE